MFTTHSHSCIRVAQVVLTFLHFQFLEKLFGSFYPLKFRFFLKYHKLMDFTICYMFLLQSLFLLIMFHIWLLGALSNCFSFDHCKLLHIGSCDLSK